MIIFWFRRDLRLNDNKALYYALNQSNEVKLIFIFDTDILKKTPNKSDKRINFIHSELSKINFELHKYGGNIDVYYGKPLEVFRKITTENKICKVFANADYEPSAIKRDTEVFNFLRTQNIEFSTFKDHVIFHEKEIVKKDGNPYTVFTPYSKKWKERLTKDELQNFPSENLLTNIYKSKRKDIPSLSEIGYNKEEIFFPAKEINIDIIKDYNHTRDFPAKDGTSKLSVHLRFGTISIRELVKIASRNNETFLNELIWRDFYQMIIWFFPETVDNEFKQKYRFLQWRNNEEEFAAWCEGKTGYPFVDAGISELNSTGFMHNRLRMITASFLTKHLLIDWRWGEAYFASKLIDYEIASNVGGWQWAASTGCDAVPYFRIFNPESQMKKFDKEREYVRKWIPEIQDISKYPKPIVDYNFGRERALHFFKGI